MPKVIIQAIILLLLTLSLPQASIAGGLEGGGGKGVVCQGPIRKTVELLDLWEARILHNEVLDPSLANLGLEAGVNILFERLKNSYLENIIMGGGSESCTDQECLMMQLRKVSDRFLLENSRVHRLRSVTLELTDDSFEIAKPENCEILQIVNYQPGGDIYINQDLFEQLSPLNQIALVAHEAYYAFLRRSGEASSIRTRRVIGYVTGGHSFERVNPKIPSHYYSCSNMDETFPANIIKIYPVFGDSQNILGMEIYPEVFGGTELIGVPESSFQYIYFASVDWISRLMSTGCQHVDSIEPLIDSKYFDGPVEFDKALQLHLMCDNPHGMVGLYATLNDPNAKAEKKLVTLRCERH